MNDTHQYWYAAVVAILILLIGIVGSCELREKEKEAEYLGRMETSAFDREGYVGMADRVLAAKVEREWREQR